MIFPKLQNKVVFVTGANQGIGQAVSKTFLDEGSVVVEADLAFENEDLKKLDGKTYQIHIDVASEASVQHVVEQLQKAELIPNVLAHVAGISTMDYLVDSKTSDFDKTISVNTKGTYLIAKNIVNLMLTKDRPGKVIFMASQAGKNGYRAKNTQF